LAKKHDGNHWYDETSFLDSLCQFGNWTKFQGLECSNHWDWPRYWNWTTDVGGSQHPLFNITMHTDDGFVANIICDIIQKNYSCQDLLL